MAKTENNELRKKQYINIKILISKSYLTILPLFKSMVLIFEQKKTLAYKLHDVMINNLRSFLACFVKYEVIKVLSSRQFKKVNILENIRRPGDSSLVIVMRKLLVKC